MFFQRLSRFKTNKKKILVLEFQKSVEKLENN